LLRIDSPGGSALTSDLIWREIELTKVKPIVVSMGNYAASGGYYIACNANTILLKIILLLDP
jgi:protease-4